MDFSQIKNVLGGVLEVVSEKGKGYLETVSEMGKEVVDTAKDKTRTAGRVAKLTMEINAEKTALEDVFTELGKIYYDECASSAMGIFAQLCEEISFTAERIDVMEAELAELKASLAPGKMQECECDCDCDCDEGECCCCEEDGEFCCPEQAEGTCCCEDEDPDITVEIVEEEAEEKPAAPECGCPVTVDEDYQEE